MMMIMIDKALGYDSVESSTCLQWFLKLKKAEFDLKDQLDNSKPQEFENENFQDLSVSNPKLREEIG